MMGAQRFDNTLEQEYLSAVLLDGSLENFATLDPSDFCKLIHRQIYEAMLAMDQRGERIEWHGLLAELGAVEGSSHFKVLLDISNSRPVPYSEGAEKRLKQLGNQRRIEEALRKAQAANDNGDPDEAWKHVEQAATVGRSQRRFEVFTFGECAKQAYEAAIQPDYEVDGKVYLGIEWLHQQLGRLPGDSMMVIGGKTGAGKSSLMIRMSIGMIERGLRPGIVTLEDGPMLWGQRAVGLVSKVSGAKMQREELDENERQLARKALDDARLSGGYVAKLPDGSLDDCVGAIEYLVQRKKCGVVFVDYLQNLMLPETGNYHHSISRAAKRLRMTCARLGVPLILGSQLKRLEEGVEPQLTHLKESGDIENQAKVVLLLWTKCKGLSPAVHGKIAKCSAAHAGQPFTVTRGESGAFAEIVGR